jgi:hypothetical protein
VQAHFVLRNEDTLVEWQRCYTRGCF